MGGQKGLQGIPGRRREREPDLDSALRPVVVILLGVQGTGKTTLAEHAARWLHVPLFSKDELEATLMAVGYRPRWQLALGAYELLTRWLERSCGLGNPPSSTVWLHWSASAPLVRPRRGVRRSPAHCRDYLLS